MNKEKPATLTASIRIDVDTLAVLAQYSGKAGIGGSRGGLIRESLKNYAQALLEQELVEPIESTEAALEILAGLGYGLDGTAVTSAKRGMPSFGASPQAPATPRKALLTLTADEIARIEEAEEEIRKEKASATID